MELSLKTICFMLGYLTFCRFQCSSASSRGLENQTCGNEKFYIPTDTKCYDRNLRCTAESGSLDPCTGVEANCYACVNESGIVVYYYYRKESPITSRKKRSIFSRVLHWFVEYRGFVYEFGNYGYQELDINDPNYKYGPGREKVVAENLVGTSSCRRKQVTGFIDKWLKANPNYYLFANNCQDFATALLRELGNNCSERKDEEIFTATCKCDDD